LAAPTTGAVPEPKGTRTRHFYNDSSEYECEYCGKVNAKPQQLQTKQDVKIWTAVAGAIPRPDGRFTGTLASHQMANSLESFPNKVVG
jgi:hypothetical protein